MERAFRAALPICERGRSFPRARNPRAVNVRKYHLGRVSSYFYQETFTSKGNLSLDWRDQPEAAQLIGRLSKELENAEQTEQGVASPGRSDRSLGSALRLSRP